MTSRDVQRQGATMYFVVVGRLCLWQMLDGMSIDTGSRVYPRPLAPLIFYQEMKGSPSMVTRNVASLPEKRHGLPWKNI